MFRVVSAHFSRPSSVNWNVTIGREWLGLPSLVALTRPDNLASQRVLLKAGEVYLAPREVWHGDSVFIGDEEYGECWILDVFAPPRDDLRSEG